MAINESQLALLKVQMKRATSSEWNRTRDTGSAWQEIGRASCRERV